MSVHENTHKVETRMAKWDEKMRMVEPIVHAQAVVQAVERAGVMIKSVADDLLSLLV